MAWERRNGRPCYYRKRRIGRRVVSKYVGGGEIGELAALADEARREEREAARIEEQRRREAEADLDRTVEELGEMTNLLTRAVLIAQGAHTHKGEWRGRKKVNG